MTKQRITIEQNPLTKETLTLNALCLAYELPQYSVRERKGSSKSKLYNVYMDDSLIFYGTIQQVKYYLLSAIYLITRVQEHHTGERWKKLERLGKPNRPHFQIRDVDKTRLSGSVAKSEPRRAYKKEIQLIFFVSKHIIPHQPQKVKRGEQIWKDYYISVLYS